jgi:hypothetical protein
VLDARQLLDEAPAAGNHQRIVTDVAGRGLDDPPAVTQARHLGGHVHHLHAPKEVRQRHYQLFARAQTRGNPDRAGKIVQLRARRDHGDLDFRIAAADFKHAGERAEAGADDGNAGGWIHERRLLVGRGLQGAKRRRGAWSYKAEGIGREGHQRSALKNRASQWRHATGPVFTALDGERTIFTG